MTNVDNSSAIGPPFITVPPMVISRGLRSTAVVWLLVVAVLVLGTSAGCAASIGGTAQGSTTHGSAKGPPPSASAADSRSAVGSAAPGAPESSGAVSGGAPLDTGLLPTAARGSTPAQVAGRMWTADLVLTGGRGDIISPTGDVTAVVDDRGVCLHAGRPEGQAGADAGTGAGVGQCVLSFAAGVTPAFAVFSPSGAHLLVVAGPAARSEVYVIDVRSWAAQVIGSQGFGPVVPSPPTWDLSSAAWDVDGAAVLLVPRTGEAAGAVLGAELTGGPPYERVRMPAGLVNSSPSLWSSIGGLAVVANAGDQRNTLWWADFSSGAVRGLATLGDSHESLVLTAADPLGRTVLVCQRGPDGALGPTFGIAVTDGRTAPLLPGSQGCAGAVFSSDGRYLAVADQRAAGYTLSVVETASGATVLSAPLRVPTPSAPPYLTWTGDVIVASDVTGQWPLSAAVLRIQR